jgi:hypothetical protein
VLDASGFPKKSRIFPGNVSEPATLKEMIDSLSGNDDASQTDNEVKINHHDLPEHITLKTTIDQNLQTKPQTTPGLLHENCPQLPLSKRSERVLTQNFIKPQTPCNHKSKAMSQYFS